MTEERTLRLVWLSFALVACTGTDDGPTGPEGCEEEVVLPNDLTLDGSGESDGVIVGFCNNYNVVGGSLTITARQEIRRLQCVCAVEGDLVVDSTLLPSLEGLDNIARVGGDVLITSNVLIEDIDALSSVASVGGSLTVSVNNALANIDGLSGIADVPGDLVIAENTGLQNLDGLGAVAAVGGDLIVTDTGVTDIGGLGSVVTVGGVLTIDGNESLAAISGTTALTSIGGNLLISGNTAAVDLAGLAGLTAIPGELVITDNQSLEDVSALYNLVSIAGKLEVSNNRDLSYLDGFRDLASVGGQVRIVSNPSLQRAELPLTVIDTKLEVHDCPALAEIALPALTGVIGTMSIQRNATLTTTWFPELTETATLELRGNAALEYMAGFRKLEAIGLDLIIDDNDALTDLSGLNSIQGISRDLIITNNDSLPTAEAHRLRDEIGTDNIERDIVIEGNAE